MLERRSDLPTILHPRRMYLLGQPEKWAVFACPCGRGHAIDLNLSHSGRARWAVMGKDRPTIYPSVDVRGDRRCHFWLSDGLVCWCED